MSGSSFATYGRALQADFVITSGAEEITTFERKPGNVIAFCRRCGSQVPHPPAGNHEFEFGAGLLDDDPEVDIAYHIFVDSRAPWIELRDDLPKFAEINQHRVVTQRTRSLRSNRRDDA